MKCRRCHKYVPFIEWYMNGDEHKECLQKEKVEIAKRKEMRKKGLLKDEVYQVKEKEFDLSREVKSLGIILIVLGIIHVISFRILDPTWGIVLVITGIIALFYRSRRMILTSGIFLILIGISNIFLSFFGGVYFFWMVFGVFQIMWGYKTIKRFRIIKEDPKYIIKEKKKKAFVWYGLRIGFYVMLGCGLISYILGTLLSAVSMAFMLFSFFYFCVVLFTLVLSIIHLTKYRNKALAITSLVLSSINLLITIVFFIYGIFLAANLLL